MLNGTNPEYIITFQDEQELVISDFGIWNLELGAYLLNGIWDLEFGTCDSIYFNCKILFSRAIL